MILDLVLLSCTLWRLFIEILNLEIFSMTKIVKGLFYVILEAPNVSLKKFNKKLSDKSMEHKNLCLLVSFEFWSNLVNKGNHPKHKKLSKIVLSTIIALIIIHLPLHSKNANSTILINLTMNTNLNSKKAMRSN